MTTTAASATEILAELESLGSAQTRKIYRRHGVSGPQFGVKYADLGKLKKRLKVDHPLALALWKSGNHDARVLATMIADPARLTAAQLDRWVETVVDDHVLSDAVAQLAVQTEHAIARGRAWCASPDEFVAATGWNVFSRLAQADGVLEDAILERALKSIEATIHDRPNRTRHSMNGALIAIGIRSAAFAKKATAAAKRIGTVEVDHGETSCKTPDAAAYIKKTRAHRAKTKKKR